jgi:hypothetical protein
MPENMKRMDTLFYTCSGTLVDMTILVVSAPSSSLTRDKDEIHPLKTFRADEIFTVDHLATDSSTLKTGEEWRAACHRKIYVV